MNKDSYQEKELKRVHHKNCGCEDISLFHLLKTFKKTYPYLKENHNYYFNVFGRYYKLSLIEIINNNSEEEIVDFIKESIPVIKNAGCKNVIGVILNFCEREENILMIAISIFHHNGYSLNKKSHQMVPLEIAYRKGFFNILDNLVIMGADFSLVSNETNDWYFSNRNTLMNKIFYGNYSTVEGFLNGEITNLPIEFLRKIFSKKLASFRQGYIRNFEQILINSVKSERKDLLDFFLDEILDIGIHRKELNSAFNMSLTYQNIPMVVKFLDFGIDVNLSNKVDCGKLTGSVILLKARYFKNLELLYHFINYGGNLNTPGNFFIIIDNEFSHYHNFEFFKSAIDCGFSMNYENFLCVKNRINFKNIPDHDLLIIRYLSSKGMRIYFEEDEDFKKIIHLINVN